MKSEDFGKVSALSVVGEEIAIGAGGLGLDSRAGRSGHYPQRLATAATFF